MKTIFIFVAGSTFPGIINQITAHPQIVDIALGILLGALLGLLVATVFVGPTPTPKVVTPKVNKTRKTKRIIEQPAKAQYGLNIFNYTPTEWGIA